MSIDKKLVTIADNVEKVYGKGYSDSEEEIWKLLTRNGEKEDYPMYFRATNLEGYNIPDGYFKPTGNIDRIFYDYRGKELPGGLDFSELGTTNPHSTAAYQMLFTWSKLEHIYDIGFPAYPRNDAVTYHQTFLQCNYLKKIDILRVEPRTSFNGTFGACYALESLTIEGVIGKNGFSVKDCPLNHDSLMSIINALEDKTGDESGTSWVITLGATNLEKLTDEEKAIATDRGWSLA